jgi:hypothetical protein
MNWPPCDRAWKEIAEELPIGADLAVFKDKVCAVAANYLNAGGGTADHLHEEICKQLGGVDFHRLRAAVEHLRALPVHYRPPGVDRFELQALYDLVEHSKGQIARREHYSLKRNSDGALYFNLLWVLRETGLPWSKSDSGPTVRVFKAITDCLLREPLTPRAIKAIIDRTIAEQAAD